ncbi:hypothetical protein PInf_006666 [Phytophthora infestans]|nr:hypothetical protein PInf_006666 [Phytophthora infestans]
MPFSLPDDADPAKPRKWPPTSGASILGTLCGEFPAAQSGGTVEVSADAEHGFAFGTIIYNTGVFMKWLQKEVRQLGATFEQRRVNDFNVEDCDLLVNCSGLAARDLAGDDTVYPIRGQIIKARKVVFESANYQ